MAKTHPQLWRVLAGLNGFVALVMGAVGAHALHEPYAAGLVEKASLYQLVHAALLFYLSGVAGRAAQISRALILAGLLLLCGSLYLKALCEIPSVLAPTGGIALMLGWLVAGLTTVPPAAGQ